MNNNIRHRPLVHKNNLLAGWACTGARARQELMITAASLIQHHLEREFWFSFMATCVRAMITKRHEKMSKALHGYCSRMTFIKYDPIYDFANLGIKTQIHVFFVDLHPILDITIQKRHSCQSHFVLRANRPSLAAVIHAHHAHNTSFTDGNDYLQNIVNQ